MAVSAGAVGPVVMSVPLSTAVDSNARASRLVNDVHALRHELLRDLPQNGKAADEPVM